MNRMKNKIKIAYIINSLEVGGAERFTVDLINNLNTDRFEPILICVKTQALSSTPFIQQAFQFMRFQENQTWFVAIGKCFAFCENTALILFTRNFLRRSVGGESRLFCRTKILSTEQTQTPERRIEKSANAC